jgi:periplasmic protein TonB
MELKKSEKADLESRKGIFFQIGLIFAMAVILVAFEWKSYDALDISTMGDQRALNEVEELATITQQNTPPPPPPPPAPSMVLNIVENTAEIDDDISIDAEADENTQVEEYKAPVMKQVDEEVVEEQEIFMVVENAPAFPGGDVARMKFLQDNIKYPQMARESGIQGTVYVTFVVERNGNVTDVKILRGIGGGCDEEAVRVVQNMPKWEPGKQRGKPVRVQFNMPIKFTLAG